MWVVVHEISFEPSSVLGVYDNREAAVLAASHPYEPMTVYRFFVNAEPTDGALIYPEHKVKKGPTQ